MKDQIIIVAMVLALLATACCAIPVSYILICDTSLFLKVIDQFIIIMVMVDPPAHLLKGNFLKHN